ncbi:MAG: phosphate ABC transporter permease PstA [Candidatus Promineifilaceae bacterium]|nr:phosphate ABC transporter permease PstA [Candidatus Promineifilaceae bacterium]
MIDPDFITRRVEEDNPYPQGEEMRAQIGGRRRSGLFGRILFIFATISAIFILLVLLLSIINQSFGLVAQQEEVPEISIVTDFHKRRVNKATNIVLSGEDDQALAEAIGQDPNGVGFFGYAYYQANADQLRALSIDGIEPNLANVQNGEYPGARPLFIYSSPTVIEEKPEVAAFLAYYLENLDEVVAEIGYFPAENEALNEQRTVIADALGVDNLSAVNPADFSGSIALGGSSTVFPVSQAMVDRFVADGFAGEITIESTGTGAGFDAFCAGNNIDVVNASRAADSIEYEACQAAGRDLLNFQIGNDVVVVAVSSANEFASTASREQLESLFTESVNWVDANAEWPNEAVSRYIPSTESGTMDVFVRTVFLEQTLSELPYDGLVSAYVANVSAGRCRAVEREQKFYDNFLICDEPTAYSAACAGGNAPEGCTAPPRTHKDLELLVQSEVVKPRILKSWYLYPSLFEREEIALEASREFPNAEVSFTSWLSLSFVTNPQSGTPELAGVRTAILGSIWVVIISVLVAFPLGTAAAIYLEEYADNDKWHNRVIQTNINNLAGVPSIIYGMLGLAVFVRALEPITSGAAFGILDAGATANGRTILSAGLTLGLLGLPIVIIAAQEAIKSVPPSLKEASMGLGATKWQTIWYHVLPNAMPGILTGTILTMSRVIGETAPLVVVGASTFITTDPTGPFSKFTTMPAQIYQWTTRPQDAFRNIAGAAIIVLLILLLTLNAAAIILRNRFSRRFV